MPTVEPIDALLFDFDGTLADSFGAITASVNATRQHYGLAGLAEAQVRTHVGLGLDQLMIDLVPGADPLEAVEFYREHHRTVFLPLTRLLQGVEGTLSELHRRGLKMGVCSNKRVEFTRQLVAHLGIGPVMDCVLGPDDVGAAKPDPAMLVEGCRRLGVSINRTIYIGDMAVDVATARAAGMRVWLVPGGAGAPGEVERAGADVVLGDFGEVLGRVPSVETRSSR